MKVYLFTNKNYCEPTSCVLQHKNKAEDEYRKKTCDCFYTKTTPKRKRHERNQERRCKPLWKTQTWQEQKGEITLLSAEKCADDTLFCT